MCGTCFPKAACRQNSGGIIRRCFLFSYRKLRFHTIKMLAERAFYCLIKCKTHYIMALTLSRLPFQNFLLKSELHTPGHIESVSSFV